MSPKLFARLQRFQRAKAIVQEAPTVDWAELAVACGYYDQWGNWVPTACYAQPAAPAYSGPGY